MVERAAELAKGANLDNLSFQVGNILDLPFEDNNLRCGVVVRGDGASGRAGEGDERTGPCGEAGWCRGDNANGLGSEYDCSAVRCGQPFLRVVRERLQFARRHDEWREESP